MSEPHWDDYSDMIGHINKLEARIETLEAALHEAFMAMCAYRDNKDEEVFQDAIDALGLVALAPEQDK